MNAIETAEAYFHIAFKRVGSTEWRSLNGCPKCGDGGKGQGSDRFRLFDDDKPLVWCRQCGYTAFIDNLDGSNKPTEAQLLDIRIRQVERKQAELEARMTVLERMHNCHDHLLYHRTMTEDAVLYWNMQGMLSQTIERYQLGYCQRCPTDHDHRPSYTIPVISNGQLWNIRHRLVGADNGDKYRPHMAGLPNVLFNADNLRNAGSDILIVEGEKKSIIADQTGLLTVGVMGKSGFDKAWAAKFSGFQRVYVCYDPDATNQAAEVAKLFEHRGRVVVLPDKLDDLVVNYGATLDDLRWFVDAGRPV